jgi:hypothetical protein
MFNLYRLPVSGRLDGGGREWWPCAGSATGVGFAVGFADCEQPMRSTFAVLASAALLYSAPAAYAALSSGSLSANGLSGPLPLLFLGSLLLAGALGGIRLITAALALWLLSGFSVSLGGALIYRGFVIDSYLLRYLALTTAAAVALWMLVSRGRPQGTILAYAYALDRVAVVVLVALQAGFTAPWPLILSHSVVVLLYLAALAAGTSGTHAPASLVAEGSPAPVALVCPHCQAPRSQAAAFCSQCGQPVDRTTPRYCSSCGAELRSGLRFCDACGASLTAAV